MKPGRPSVSREEVIEAWLLRPEAKTREIADQCKVSRAYAQILRGELVAEHRLLPKKRFATMTPEERQAAQIERAAEQERQHDLFIEKKNRIKQEEIERRARIIEKNKQREQHQETDLSDEIAREDSPRGSIPSPEFFTELTNSLITGGELAKLGMTESDYEDSDDETRKKFLKRLRYVSLNESFTTEMQMAAMALWTKLKNETKRDDLGPGVPMTKEDVVERYRRMFVATGPETVLVAIDRAFNLSTGANDAGEVPINDNSTAQGPIEPPSTPGSEPNVQ